MLHNWADELTEEEARKLAEFREGDVPKEPTPERLLADFGHYFGWSGVRDVLENKISARLFISLLREARRGERERQAQQIADMRLAVGSIFDENGQSKAQNAIKERLE